MFGTYLHGSVLPKNPKLTDFIIKKALEAKYNKEITLKQLDDEIENRTNKLLIGKKY